MPIEEDVIVGQIDKNKQQVIRVTLSNFKGHDLVGLRIWFKAGDDFKPSSKGIAINVRVLPQLIGMLEAAEKKAVELGVLNLDGEVPAPPEPAGDE